MVYVLICLAVTLAILIAPAFVPKHSPTHPRTHCRCGKRADIIDPDRPWRVWCATCHVRYLLNKGEVL
ncbi:MAG: hypothetical protein M3R61_00050 [Chloroflexota bacterium]|nr:hypothetical protein [Chloroflexota bacterium]